MTRKLLDTTFLIHYWGGRSDTEAYLDAHEEESEFLTTTLNVKEIAVGRELQGAFDAEEIRSTFGWLSVVPFNTEHAFHAGQLEAEIRRRDGVNQDKINALAGDILIAAVAKDANATVVTRNDEDFALFDGVSVETY
jgi:predicted nucleic acid-binding protein